MCLAIPVQIKEIIDENTAVAEISGLKKTISTALLEDVKVGDYVILHVGYALRRSILKRLKRHWLFLLLRPLRQENRHEVHHRVP